MKPIVIIAIAVVCSVVAILVILIGIESYEQTTYKQNLAKYDKFVVEANSLLESHTLRGEMEKCAWAEMSFGNTSCKEKMIESFRTDFQTLILQYDYEDKYIELFQIWGYQFFYAYEMKKIEMTDYDKSDIEKYWEYTQKLATIQMYKEFGQRIQNNSDVQNNSTVDFSEYRIANPSLNVQNNHSQIENPSNSPYIIRGGDRLVAFLEFATSQKTILYEVSRDTDEEPSTNLCPDCKSDRKIGKPIFSSEVECNFRGSEVCQQGWIVLELWFGQYLLEIDGNSIPITVSENGSSSPILKSETSSGMTFCNGNVMMKYNC